MNGFLRIERERLPGILAGLGAVMMLSACERPAMEVAGMVAEKPTGAILLGAEDAVDFREFLDGVGVLCGRAPVRFRHPELAVEIVFGSIGAIPACGSSIQVRDAEVLMDQEVVSLTELEAKVRVYADAAASAQSNPPGSLEGAFEGRDRRDRGK